MCGVCVIICIVSFSLDSVVAQAERQDIGTILGCPGGSCEECSVTEAPPSQTSC